MAHDDAAPEEADVVHKDKPIPIRKNWYRNAVIFSVLLCLPGLLILAGAAAISSFTSVHFGWWTLGWSLFILGVVYNVTSVKIQQENQLGGIFVLQQPAKETAAGLVFVPHFVTEHHTLPVTEIQDELPGEPENTSKRPDDEGLKEGENRPMRVTTAGKPMAEIDENTHPLDVPLTLELSAPVVWSFNLEGGFFAAWNRIDGSTTEEKKTTVRRRLVDSVDVQVAEKLAHKSLEEFRRELAKFNEDLCARMQSDVSHWGVRIHRAHVKSPDVPKIVNEALAALSAAVSDTRKGILKARGEMIQTKTAADAERYRLEQEAHGKKAARVLEAEGIKEASELIDMPGREIRHIEALEATISGASTKYVFGAPSTANILGLAGLESLEKDDKKGPEK